MTRAQNKLLLIRFNRVMMIMIMIYDFPCVLRRRVKPFSLLFDAFCCPQTDKFEIFVLQMIFTFILVFSSTKRRTSNRHRSNSNNI